MNAVTTPTVTYTPGSGYTGYLPGCDRPALRWGDEFWAQVKEQAKQNAANQTERDPGPTEPGLFMPDELENFSRKEPAEADIAELVGKYDPEHMSQEEYDAFLEDLVDAGILSKYELGALDYHGFTVVGSIADGALDWGIGNYTADTKNPEWDNYFSRYGMASSLQEAKGNALAYAKLKTLWKPAPECDAGWLHYAEKKYDAFTALANVLDAMAKSPARGAANTAPVSRKELSDDEIADLAGKYNPGHMSQAEFDAFLKELVEREYLTKNEIGRLGYGGAVVTGSLADGTAFGGSVSITDMSKLPGGIPAFLSSSLANVNGDILSWAKVRALMEPISADTEARLQFEKETNDAFKALAAVLDAMQAQRK